jgi:hypothetical protein
VTLARTTAQAALGYALSLVGRSRKLGNAVWTTSSVIDDCARFCSHVLWNGNPGPISWVDTFKSAGDGTYHRGKAGLQPGDVVLFDWESNGVGNHVEFCLTSPSSTGAFTTVGANGSDTVAVKVRNRNGYVLGYFRPAWGSASPTPAQPRPEQTTKENTVSSKHYRNTKTKAIRLIDPNGTQDFAVANQDYVNLNRALGVASGDVTDVPENQFGYLQQLARANRDAIADAVWGKRMKAANGTHSAEERLIGADTKAGTASVTVDSKTADSIASGVISRLAALFTKK